ncbi:MAG: M20 family metallopeptidase [Nanoarchaeota archaeon]|nr:M20 family metallopeptidase [Nanoarchaeota archaeon]
MNHLENQISGKIEKQKEKILQFTKELIKIPTQNPPGENYDKIVGLIKKELDSDLEIKIYSKNDKPNLVAKWNVGAKKTLHINGHYDVVPITTNWKHNPFIPEIEGNKLFGRGSQDMKSGLAIMVYSIKILKELNIRPACNIELSFTCDEESGGIDGLGFLVKNKLIKPDYALVLDGVNQITNAHKGVLALEITVIGKSAHAAWPSRGINAFTGACKLAGELNSLNDKLTKIKSKCETEDEITKSPTIVLGGVTIGGNKFNTIPGEFSFTIDRRIIPEEKISDAKTQINKMIDTFKKNNPEYKIKIKTLLEAEPASTDKNSRIGKVFFDAVKKVKRKTPSFTMISGFLDMRFFVNNAKIDCIAYCARGENLHGDDEFVYIDSIFDNTKILIYTMLDQELNKK